MNILKHNDKDFVGRLFTMAEAQPLFDEAIDRKVKGILKAVKKEGDKALVRFAKKFDGVNFTERDLFVSIPNLHNASWRTTEDVHEALDFAHRNIEAFHRAGLRKPWQGRNEQGAKVGEKYDPYRRVGVYIPGGTASLVSTALMTITLAKVAGCRQICVCTPPGKDGRINDHLIHACRMAGAREIYKVGGAQAIAAMAYGTRIIKPVQKIFGPGNAYVVAAKRLLFGRVSIDLLPGPSELLVLADETANAKFVAADMLAQAEHGSGHERCWLVTSSGRLLRAVERELQKQLPKLSRRRFIDKALKNAWLIQVANINDAVGLTNDLAPEHCEVMVQRPKSVVRDIVTAGAIFVGSWSPTVLGDYVAGPSHTLPTGGAGRSFAGLTVDQFQRRTSVVEYSKAALKKSLAAVEKIAGMEGLDAHGRSASIRLD
ncbi:MAG: histidinol dehydrogenase [Verrucomicrobiales bacterium]|nr:histidinol dehydrogenase [Verrucomicrobiales bacterium]|tara:strand:- start:3228 stop:4517 length:1290 start_codon:yes stop_codon:yes gene_type:complete